MSQPLISAVIPTHNRAELLRGSLESLACQSLAPEQYEVVVVDDGSADATREVCDSLTSRMELKYFCIDHSGISAAKNLGIFAAQAPIVLFFDDDDCAAPTLLEEHLACHRRYPKECTAVLGYTAWAPSLRVTQVMHYVMDVGRLLFCYNMPSGKRLDFTYFWGGRSSCKRSFLVRHGVFRQEFRAILEDIELGYRLARHGLEVVFHRDAVQYMTRPITFDEFCRRCQRQGQAQVQFGRLYPHDPLVQQYCRLSDSQQRWPEMAAHLSGKVARVRELEGPLDAGADQDRDCRVGELHGLYRWTFDAFRVKSVVETLAAQERCPAPA
jgi:cellulose synthase/poly-beta-1,6-N-acetylglucosamine synthase-like glycosyltransferase